MDGPRMRLNLLLALAFGCTGKTPGDTSDTQTSTSAIPGEAIVGSTQRDTSPSTANVSQLYAENADFSFDLLRTVYAAGPGNQVLSP